MSSVAPSEESRLIIDQNAYQLDSSSTGIDTATSPEYYNADSELVYRRHAKQTEDLRNLLTQTKKHEDEIKGLKNKRERGFYIKQNELIDQFLAPLKEGGDSDEDDENDFKVKVAINGSLLVNIVLFTLQITAAIITGSLSLVSTSIDAFMDLLSGFILFMTARARKKRNYFEYPTGKSRMEPVGIIIFAALMSTVSINLIIEGSTSLIKQNDKELSLGIIPIAFVGLSIVCKIVMYLYCRVLTHSSSAMILATDHRNDITVNSFGIGMAILGTYVKWWLDPVGALIVALIILRSWTSEAYEQIELLVGKSASPEFLQRLTYIAVSHSPEILKVDTCRAFHVGNNLFVEVDIVLPENMPLIRTHDIGESLQIKLESLPEVERAFVHVDYEFRHKPEHKRIN
ncbi:putative cation efflux pump [Heterostelium album PN500]|uniref:Putative cation efflux pump n=1 Tax=Heterostelium pallidum (strain ATCC 26659 / Pp 5 / PN500) TaxID=670386 RepID=D3BM80_HETP5|nr:putative cation efflux pump [Heterostelium album PN500]EFA77681.1 putative cation efflux pump [Heterostelium album PN500]|eukprot:XP_020429809.1 putative cation efflux pump [Heterostelium album PN500]